MGLEHVVSEFGPVTYSRDGDILIAENEIVRMAYVETDDPKAVGTVGWHNDVWVEFISPELAKRWNTMSDLDEELRAMAAKFGEAEQKLIERALNHRDFVRGALRDAQASLADLEAQIKDLQRSFESFPDTENT